MTLKQVLQRGIDWDKAREILARLAGRRPEIEEMRRLFRSGHVYQIHMVDRLENDLVRAIVHRLNKDARAEGRFGEMVFNFTEVLDDGSKKQFYEQYSEASPELCAQLAKNEFRKGYRQIRKAYEIYDESLDRHGDEFKQLMLEFPMPPRPDDDC